MVSPHAATELSGVALISFGLVSLKFVPDYDIECGIIYNEFIALNTHMTQKAHLRIDELESEIKELKQIINSLQGVA